MNVVNDLYRVNITTFAPFASYEKQKPVTKITIGKDEK